MCRRETMARDRTTVAVVNADPGCRRLIEALLAGEHALEAAADPPAGLARIAAGGIDLVLLVLPPSLEGLSLCSQVRARRRAFLPVLVLTPPLSRARQRAIVAAGATDQLSTPLAPEDFQQRVRVWARAHRRLQGFYRRLLTACDAVPDDSMVEVAAPDHGTVPGA
jgi:DNA-binding response OmpR family regulator